MTALERIKNEIKYLKNGRDNKNIILSDIEGDQLIKTIESLIIAVESRDSQVKSLKAITELALRGLKEIKGYKIQWFDTACSAMISISSFTLDEIERLQNETT